MSRPPLTAAAVVADAADLADRAGFDAVTLSEVARRLGVRTPSLYAHVRDLAALRDGVTALALGELADLVTEAIAGRSGGEALRGFADAHRVFAARSPGRWQALQRRAGAAAVGSDGAARLATLTTAMLLGYGLSPSDRVHAVRLIASTVNGFITLERAGTFDHRRPGTDASWGVALDTLSAALTAWPAARTKRVTA